VLRDLPRHNFLARIIVTKKIILKQHDYFFFKKSPFLLERALYLCFNILAGWIILVKGTDDLDILISVFITSEKLLFSIFITDGPQSEPVIWHYVPLLKFSINRLACV
jgi:hypothetical protein